MKISNIEKEKEKIVLLLGTGNFGKGSVETLLKYEGYFYIRKYLTSSVNNWESILKILHNEGDRVQFFLAKITEYVIFLLCLPQYSQVSGKLMSFLRKKPHQIYIYNENLFGHFSSNLENRRRIFKQDGDEFFEDYVESDLEKWCYEWNFQGGTKSAIEKMKKVVQDLVNSDANIAPYRKIVDIDISAQSFIEHTISGLILRVYVPNKRLWSRELDRIIILFKDYVSQVSKIKVNLSQKRTNSGVTFSIYSPSGHTSSQDLKRHFDEFASFLDLCDRNPAQAEQILNQTNLSHEETSQIITRYVKEAKRLMIDLRHEKESRMLSIRHSLENELVESQFPKDSIDITTQITSNNIKLSSVFSLKNIFEETQKNLSPTIINVNPQFVDKVEGVIAQNIEGSTNYNTNDKELKKLINLYAENQSELISLRSALDEMRDNEISKDEKISAWQLLGRFLAKISEKVGEVGISLLKVYLEELLKGYMNG